MQYADDNTPTTADKDPEKLQKKVQSEADLVTGWFSYNRMVCSGDKTKLLIIGTGANRADKLERPGKVLQVAVEENIKKESQSEKLLGIVVNNIGTWRNHFTGDGENEGLLSKLSKTVGILRRLRMHLTDPKFRIVANGLFSSKLIYGMTVWGGVWGLPGYDEETRNGIAVTKEDMRRLQVLQNQVMRMMTRLEQGTTTELLCNRSNQLSVHQLVAYHSLNQVYKIYRDKKPQYHYNRLFGSNQHDTITRGGARMTSRVDFNLSLDRTSFFFQASQLWNLLPLSLNT